MRLIVGSIEGEYGRYKTLGERALEQLSDEQLVQPSGSTGNSAATLVWHISGNLASRFTDFLQSDGEKPWRDRDAEFLQRTVTRRELRAKWENGWTVLFARHKDARPRRERPPPRVTVVTSGRRQTPGPSRGRISGRRFDRPSWA